MILVIVYLIALHMHHRAEEHKTNVLIEEDAKSTLKQQREYEMHPVYPMPKVNEPQRVPQVDIGEISHD